MRLEQNSRPGVGPVTKVQQQTESGIALSVALPRFGELATPANAARIAIHAEALGYRTAWFLRDAGSSSADALAIAANLSARTRSIGFATEVSASAPDVDASRAQFATTRRVAGDRVFAGLAGAHDRSLAFDFPVPALELARSTREVVPGVALVATCQVTYQPIECERPPFHGTFTQIAADIARATRAGAAEVIIDLAYSASVATVQDFVTHLEHIREATTPGFSAHAAVSDYEDPFDYIV